MKKLNLPLLLGGIIIGIVIFVIIFPGKLTHINPYVIEGIKSVVQKNGSFVIKGAPFPPSGTNILGTDSLGRDVLSLIIYGTRLTMELGILVVLGRFLIALPVGVAAGFGNSFCKSAINLFNLLFSAIPALIISILVLRISFFLGLFKNQSIIAFVIVLTTVGWGRAAGIIRERVENILSQPFITGEKAIGKSGIKIAVENVLPHLSPEITVLLFMEMALVLSMLMELGFFGVYVGNLRVVADTSAAGMKTMNVSYEPEWASMLATSIGYLQTAPWTVISPAVTFFISIFGFNLLGEGIRDKLQNKNSRFIIYFRGIFTGKFLKNAGLIFCAIAVIATTNGVIGYYSSKIAAKQALNIVDWQFKNQVLPGSEEAKFTADKLKSFLQGAGFKPLGKDFIQYYNIDKFYSVDKYSFNIKDGSNINKLIFGKDFSLDTYGDYSLNGGIYNAREMDMFNLKDYSVFDDKFVVFDEEVYSRNAIKEFTYKLAKGSKALGVIDIIAKGDKLPAIISSEFSGKALIYMTKDAAEYLKADSKLALDIQNRSFSGEGRNVIGILPGNNAKLSKEAIMIGVGYNYMSYDRENAVKRLEMIMEAAKRLKDSSEQQGRSIIIAFWDGNLTEPYAGVKNYVTNPLYPLENTVVNIDVTNMDTKGDTLVINSQQVPVTRYFAWAFNHEFESSLKRSGINIESYVSRRSEQEILNQGPDSQEIMYYKGAVPTILALSKSDSAVTKKNTVESNFVNALLSTILNNRY